MNKETKNKIADSNSNALALLEHVLNELVELIDTNELKDVFEIRGEILNLIKQTKN